jgi:DNA mismatch endonuclease (patch repair protein)
MVDIWTKKKRSEVMSLVRSRGNKETELVLVRLLRQNKINGWRRNVSLPGKPDFTFRKHRLTVFADGCFWHCCPKHGRLPKSNRRFWRRKLSTNERRDKLVNQMLRDLGWRVLRIWEHDLALKRQMQLVRRIQKALKKQPVPSP